ncbi:MAG: S-layer homology domain-containing protein, partial [Oscillibacter sp.]|nr:S-layer homology domain-containing protein [Oscillibacter sp.]
RAHGLLSNIDAGMNEPLSRYYMAVELYNFLLDHNAEVPAEEIAESAQAIGDLSDFPNASVRGAVLCAYALGLLGGYSDGTFRGGNLLNRAQAAAIYCRLRDLIGSLPRDVEPAPEDDPPTPAPEPDSPAEAVLALVNEARAAENLPPLKLSDKLVQAAQIRAGELPELFSHTRPSGESCFTVLDEVGVSWTAVGENIAAGQSTPAAVMDSWMNSPGHRANILSGDFGTLGVGMCQSSGGYGVYWVQMFTN